MTTADWMGAIRSYLLAQSSISSLVGTRIFASSLPTSEAVSMPRKAIVLSIAPGYRLLAQDYLHVSTHGVDVRCYGETGYEAFLLHKEVYEALKQLKIGFQGLVKLYWAIPEITGESLRDPDMEWEFVLSSWRVMVGDYEATS